MKATTKKMHPGNILFNDAIKTDAKLVSLDIETLDLNHQTVVLEIGIIVAEILPKPMVKWSLEDIEQLAEYSKMTNGFFTVHRIYPSIIQQTLAGRTVSEDTVAFQKKLGFWKPSLEEALLLREKEKAISLEECRGQLKAIFSDKAIQEIWVNHPSFDMTRLESMLYEGHPRKAPWDFRKVFDIATVKYQYREYLRQLEKEEVGDLKDQTKSMQMYANEDHDAVADCAYNMAVVSIASFGNLYDLMRGDTDEV